jgi:hypothetical protein
MAGKVDLLLKHSHEPSLDFALAKIYSVLVISGATRMHTAHILDQKGCPLIPESFQFRESIVLCSVCMLRKADCGLYGRLSSRRSGSQALYEW